MYLFLEREEERETGRETSIVVASCVPPTGDLAYNPGLRLDWESNQRCFDSQASTQSTEPHQPGPKCTFKKEREEEDIITRFLVIAIKLETTSMSANWGR